MENPPLFKNGKPSINGPSIPWLRPPTPGLDDLQRASSMGASLLGIHLDHRWSNGLDVPRLKNIQKDLVAHPALSQPLGKWPLIQHVPTCFGMFRPSFFSIDNRKTSRPARFRMVPTLKSLSLQQYAHNSAISFLAGVNQLAWRVYGEKSSETANPEIIWNHSLNPQIKTMIEAFL